MDGQDLQENRPEYYILNNLIINNKQSQLRLYELFIETLFSCEILKLVI